MELTKTLENLLPYVGGLATAGGAFGTWYLRFRQQGNERQKNQLDYHKGEQERKMQLHAVELDYISKSRQDLESWFEKRLELYEQELNHYRERSSNLQQENEALQEEVDTLDAEVEKLKTEAKAYAQTSLQVITSLQNKVKQLKLEKESFEAVAE